MVENRYPVKVHRRKGGGYYLYCGPPDRPHCASLTKNKEGWWLFGQYSEVLHERVNATECGDPVSTPFDTKREAVKQWGDIVNKKITEQEGGTDAKVST